MDFISHVGIAALNGKMQWLPLLDGAAIQCQVSPLQ